ncbi:MAG: hypothetical protein GY754_21960 [bacterium]|nr:hypothetical protein [bacterium]
MKRIELLLLTAILTTGCVSTITVPLKQTPPNQQLLTGPVQIMAMSPNSQYIAAGDRTIKIWELKTGTWQHAVAAPSSEPGTGKVLFSPDNKRITIKGDSIVSIGRDPGGRIIVLTKSYKQLILREPAAGKELFTLSRKKIEQVSTVTRPGIMRAGFVTRDRLREIYTYEIWDLLKKERLALLEGHMPRCRNIQFSPNAGFVIAKENDNDTREGLRIYNIKSKKLTFFNEDRISNSSIIAISGDSKIFAYNDIFINTIKIYDLKTIKKKATITLNTGTIKTFTFSNDGKKLVIATSQGVCVLSIPHVLGKNSGETNIKIELFKTEGWVDSHTYRTLLYMVNEKIMFKKNGDMTERFKKQAAKKLLQSLVKRGTARVGDGPTAPHYMEVFPKVYGSFGKIAQNGRVVKKICGRDGDCRIVYEVRTKDFKKKLKGYWE